MTIRSEAEINRLLASTAAEYAIRNYAESAPLWLSRLFHHLE